MKLFENKYHALLEIIQHTISETRYKHSQRVAEIAVALAERHGEEREYAWLAGIAHDVCREMCDEDIEALIKQSAVILGEHIDVYMQEIRTHMILYHYHGIAAVSFLESQFPLPFEVYVAIISHTLGHPHPNTLQKILYIADSLDPARTFFHKDEWTYIYKHTALDVQMLSIIEKLVSVFGDMDSITKQMKQNIEKENR